MDMVIAVHRRTPYIAALLIALMAAAACGKSEEQKRSEEAARAVEDAGKKIADAAKKAEEAGKQAGQGSEEMAKGLEAMAKGLGALAGTKDGTAVEPVSFRELQTAFPEVPGWEKGKPTGEKMSSPIAFSKAEVVYRKGDARIEATITDSGFNQLMLLPLMWIQNTGYEKETEQGYEKARKVAGYPGFEKWNTERKDGEVNAFVNKRFILALEGRNIDDPKVLHQFAEATDLGKLAGLK
jgi:hypothetical protein